MLLRKQIKFFVTPVLIISVFFIIYQIVIFVELSNETKTRKLVPEIVHGTHERQQAFYKPNSKGQFVCVHSMETIDYKQVNDDYCDCLDGTDEPATNACPNGKFFCAMQVSMNKYNNVIPSSRVNDGVCDCCDGSDEWKTKTIRLRINKKTHLMEEFQLRCPQLC